MAVTTTTATLRLQDKFSFGAVALAGLTSLVGSALPKIPGLDAAFKAIGKTAGSFAMNVASGALSSAVTQGVAVATGLQDKFSWAGVAAAGLGNGIGLGVGRELAKGGGFFATEFGNDVVSSAASTLANAATRSAIEGSHFGDNIVAALPDAIAGVLGRTLDRTRVRSANDTHATSAPLANQINVNHPQIRIALEPPQSRLNATIGQGAEALVAANGARTQPTPRSYDGKSNGNAVAIVNTSPDADAFITVIANRLSPPIDYWKIGLGSNSSGSNGFLSQLEQNIPTPYNAVAGLWNLASGLLTGDNGQVLRGMGQMTIAWNGARSAAVGGYQTISDLNRAMNPLTGVQLLNPSSRAQALGVYSRTGQRAIGMVKGLGHSATTLAKGVAMSHDALILGRQEGTLGAGLANIVTGGAELALAAAPISKVGAVGRGGIAAEIGPLNTRVQLQSVTDRAVADLAANPSLARGLMSPGSYNHLVNRTSLAPASYGKAVERLTAQYVRSDPALSSVFSYQSKPFSSTPDFFGFEGYNMRPLDITTARSVTRHTARSYGPYTDNVIHPGLPSSLVFPR